MSEYLKFMLVVALMLFSTQTLAQAEKEKRFQLDLFAGIGLIDDFEPRFEPTGGTYERFVRPDFELGATAYYVEYTKLMFGLELSYAFKREADEFTPSDDLLEIGHNISRNTIGQHLLRLMPSIEFPFRLSESVKFRVGIVGGAEQVFHERTSRLRTNRYAPPHLTESSRTGFDFEYLSPILGGKVGINYSRESKLNFGCMIRYLVSFEKGSRYGQNTWLLSISPFISF